MRRTRVVSVFLGFLVAAGWGCERSSETMKANVASPEAASIKLLGISDCKEFPTGIPRVSAPSDQDCVEWWYVGSSELHLDHVNAGFNCCPVVDVDIHVEADTITVEEIEVEGQCMCLCLFDLDYRIDNLPPGVYHLVFVEPYRPAVDPVLECTVDLVNNPTGRYCVARSQYPWGR